MTLKRSLSYSYYENYQRRIIRLFKNKDGSFTFISSLIRNDGSLNDILDSWNGTSVSGELPKMLKQLHENSEEVSYD